MPVAIKDRPLTEKQHQERRERANKLVEKLNRAYLRFETNLIGKRIESREIVGLGGNPDTLWQEFSEVCAPFVHAMPTPDKLDFRCVLVDQEVIEYRAEPWMDWETHLQEFQQHVNTILKKRRKKDRVAIFGLSVREPLKDTRVITPEHTDRLAFAGAIAGSASEFLYWTGGDIQTAALPAAYPKTRLHKTIEYLRNIPTESLQVTRDAFIDHLERWWADHKDLICSFDRLRGSAETWIDERSDETEKSQWSLPLWANTKEGQVLSGWDCYSGALVHLNRQLGFKLMDLEKRSTQ